MCPGFFFPEQRLGNEVVPTSLSDRLQPGKQADALFYQPVEQDVGGDRVGDGVLAIDDGAGAYVGPRQGSRRDFWRSLQREAREKRPVDDGLGVVRCGRDGEGRTVDGEGDEAIVGVEAPASVAGEDGPTNEV